MVSPLSLTISLPRSLSSSLSLSLSLCISFVFHSLSLFIYFSFSPSPSLPLSVSLPVRNLARGALVVKTGGLSSSILSSSDILFLLFFSETIKNKCVFDNFLSLNHRKLGKSQKSLPTNSQAFKREREKERGGGREGKKESGIKSLKKLMIIWTGNLIFYAVDYINSCRLI